MMSTISINPDVFTMPLENVVVEAKCQIINPKTGVNNCLGMIMLLLVISVGTLSYIMNNNKSYEL